MILVYDNNNIFLDNFYDNVYDIPETYYKDFEIEVRKSRFEYFDNVESVKFEIEVD